MAAADPGPPAADRSAIAWLDELAARLPRHAAVLRHLVDGVRRDPRVVQLSIGCSVGRGTADELSDLDCELSLEPDAWPSGLELVEPLVRSAGEVAGLIHHTWAGAGTADHRRTAVIYANGVQLDVMVWPASVWSGMQPPDTVVLFARRPVFTQPWDPARARPAVEQLQEWSFLGWWALLDADKYLRRGSPWEAHGRLEEARTAIWRLTAAAQGLPFAEYGVTALLDAAHPQLPPIADTVAGLGIAELRAAVWRCAELLDAAWDPAAAVGDRAATPAAPPLARWALERLRPSPARTSGGEPLHPRRDVERWTEQAVNWLAWARTPGHDAYWLYAPEFFDSVVPDPGRRTLEIGCGEGRVARDLSRRGHRVVAVDITAMLLRSAAAASTGETYAIASAAALPFSAGAFDVIVAYNSLMDVDDMPAAIREAARVLQSGGTLCICVTHPLSDAGRFAGRDPDAAFVVEGSYLGDETFEEPFERAGLHMVFSGCRHSLESYSRALESAGFALTCVREPAIPAERSREDRRWARVPAFLFLRAVRT